jgi:hypothetical protein
MCRCLIRVAPESSIELMYPIVNYHAASIYTKSDQNLETSKPPGKWLLLKSITRSYFSGLLAKRKAFQTRRNSQRRGALQVNPLDSLMASKTQRFGVAAA